MLQYIINSSAIWLTGLIVFDMFLRREAMHRYNRLYLLLTLAAGALIPLWSWGYDSVIYATGFSAPIAEQSAVVKEAIVTGSEKTLLSVEEWPWLAYLAGMAITTTLFIKDIIVVSLLYRNGSKSKDGNWTVVETGKDTSPFSAFGAVFISHKKCYTQDELRMVLAHEEQHGRALHFIDIIMTRIAGILFWYNPLVYILERRVRMVHEYQADAIVKTDTETYGRFLVEQSVLGAPPVIAHSFIRSPLKKRLLMLTRKTTTLARVKQLVAVPVLLTAMLCCTENVFSQAPMRKGNTVTYNGNVFEFGDNRGADTVTVIDPVSGEERMIVTRFEPTPQTMNEATIYRQPGPEDRADYTNVATTGSGLTNKELKKYLVENLQNEIKKLPDGIYDFNAAQFVVLGSNGKVVYYEIGGLMKVEKKGKSENWVEIDEATKKRWGKKISTIITNMPAYEPATKNGQNVPVLIDEMLHDRMTVKNGQIVTL